MITIREALKLPCLQEAKVIAGWRGLDKKIEWFHMVDIPQVEPWIKKDRLLISVGYAFTMQPETLDGLVENLHAKGIPGILLAVGLYLKEVPDYMIEAANSLDFPIITLSADHHLEDLTRELAERILVSNALFSKYANWNQKIMDAVGSSDEICSLTKLAAEVVESHVVLLDNFGRLLTTGDNNDRYMDDLYRHFRETELKKPSNSSGLPKIGFFEEMHYFYYRLHAKNQEVAFLIVFRNMNTIHFSKMMLLQSIVVTITALLSSKKLLHNAILTAQIPMLENILYGQYASVELAYREASNLGWDLNAKHIVVVFEITNFDQYVIKHQLTEPQIIKIQANFIKSISDKIIAIQGTYPLNRDDLKLTTILRLNGQTTLSRIEQYCRDIVEYFKGKHNIEIFIGISSVVKDLSGFCNRLSEANECIKISKALNNSRVARYDAFSMEIILYKIFRNPEIQQNYLNKIKLLVDHDNHYNSHLIETLQSYIFNQGNLASTSRMLDIHRNTVKYRLKKVEELLDIQIGTTGTFLALAILLKIYEINLAAAEEKTI